MSLQTDSEEDNILCSVFIEADVKLVLLYLRYQNNIFVYCNLVFFNRGEWVRGRGVRGRGVRGYPGVVQYFLKSPVGEVCSSMFNLYVIEVIISRN